MIAGRTVIDGATDHTTAAGGDTIAAADAHLAAGDHRRAVTLLRSALTDAPHHPQLLARCAQACYGLGDYAGAAAAAYAALTVAPTDENAMTVYALALQRQGRYAEALHMAWTTADTHRESGHAQYVYAGVLAECGHLTAALDVIERAIRLDGAVADYWTLRGDIYRQLWGPTGGRSEPSAGAASRSGQCRRDAESGGQQIAARTHGQETSSSGGGVRDSPRDAALPVRGDREGVGPGALGRNATGDTASHRACSA
ncbi:TPR repeat protein [Mycolicibacterium thermoresistibile]|jgi:predicted Zn-dependent protease|uniref:TPR repeat protein n=1 Tax=Mycolicibacterium thermoresistibile TaxID=1797 RepID=A0A100XET2_MYCTH|nr:tetratricopeptide repeat protein [Mycolicibacterium thermoresistibile]GAT15334.1 TPR repeat protein [Mycolicibacterium thermoresistibile]